MKIKYAFWLPATIMKSSKLSAVQKMIFAIIMTANDDVSVLQIQQLFKESPEAIIAELNDLVAKRFLVQEGELFALAGPVQSTFAGRRIAPKKNGKQLDKRYLEMVVSCFQKVFPDLKDKTRDIKKAGANLQGLTSLPSEQEWMNVLSNIKKDEYHKEQQYKYVTIEYITRAKTIDQFIKLAKPASAPEPTYRRL
jgi:hypothetical protein